MSDLINRQAAIGKCKARLYETAMNNIGYKCDADEVLRDIAEHRIGIWLGELPSAQPEIIRCRDCKYMTEHYDTDGNVPYWSCSEWDSGTDYDGFCHYAERRTNEQSD